MIGSWRPQRDSEREIGPSSLIRFWTREHSANEVLWRFQPYRRWYILRRMDPLPTREEERKLRLAMLLLFLFCFLLWMFTPLLRIP